MYKLIDLQGDNGCSLTEKRFKTKKELIKALINFHEIDFTGVDNKDNELSIVEYFKFWKINTVQKQLDYLCEYGEWDIKKIWEIKIV